MRRDDMFVTNRTARSCCAAAGMIVPKWREKKFRFGPNGDSPTLDKSQ
jgi:hypothetical protein